LILWFFPRKCLFFSYFFSPSSPRRYSRRHGWPANFVISCLYITSARSTRFYTDPSRTSCPASRSERITEKKRKGKIKDNQEKRSNTNISRGHAERAVCVVLYSVPHTAHINQLKLSGARLPLHLPHTLMAIPFFSCSSSSSFGLMPSLSGEFQVYSTVVRSNYLSFLCCLGTLEREKPPGYTPTFLTTLTLPQLN
jgi:hypothetical protein